MQTPYAGNDPHLLQWLDRHPPWNAIDASLECRFPFTRYADILGFVQAVGAYAESADHHPDMAFGYGHCTVRWTSHDAHGITTRDLRAAEATMDAARQWRSTLVPIPR